MNFMLRVTITTNFFLRQKGGGNATYLAKKGDLLAKERDPHNLL